jgi:sec-independent protein translocase protein TatA
MGALSIWHILAIVVVVALLFGGRGRISGIMGDTAKGIKAFREGLKGEEETAREEEPPPAKPLPKPEARTNAPRTTKAKAPAKPAAKPRAKTKA